MRAPNVDIARTSCESHLETATSRIFAKRIFAKKAGCLSGLEDRHSAANSYLWSCFQRTVCSSAGDEFNRAKIRVALARAHKLKTRKAVAPFFGTGGGTIFFRAARWPRPYQFWLHFSKVCDAAGCAETSASSVMSRSVLGGLERLEICVSSCSHSKPTGTACLPARPYSE
jgi:hypothetical protein